MQIANTIAQELSVRPQQITAAISLIDEGATIPFIARYRKEQTGALDDGQLRTLHQRLQYLRDLEQRRDSIIESIRSQNKLTGQLEQQLRDADNKARLEDLYLPYKPKRRNKATVAREAGLQPLADKLLQSDNQVAEIAAAYLNPDHGILNSDDALSGAEQILIEQWSENADLLLKLRQWFKRHGELNVRVMRGKQEQGAKFRDYFDYREAIGRIPSHRALAVMRGQQEGILKAELKPAEGMESEGGEMISRFYRLHSGQWLQRAVTQCWLKLQSQLGSELQRQLKEQAEEEAIKVFGRNLNSLLLAAPAGNKITMGLDPGLRTGVKVAVVDGTGKLLDHTAIFPHAPRNQWDQSLHQLQKLVKQHQVELIAVGNGTASRETEQLCQALNKQLNQPVTNVVVSEAGASVYSASELAAEEFPDLDVTIRGAISIARRLQDPLAELVKIDPKSIGVGQYQHDVNQNQLATALDGVVEDCVNHVGVDLNTASCELLSHIAGLNKTIARNIVCHRDENGPFNSRRQLLKVSRLGPKAFEQSAGFLRISDGKNPLDNSAVHPESYSLVADMAGKIGCSEAELMGNDKAKGLAGDQALAAQYGEFTLRDVLAELQKPGRDPRPEFRTASLAEGIEKPSDLEVGMQLEGTVTNVTNFGAFVDIGVHQDGLVHISQLADKFVSDPHTIVSTGDIVSVKVLEVDLQRKRISLTMKQQAASAGGKPDQKQAQRSAKQSRQQPSTQMGSLGDKLRQAGIKR